MINPNNTRLVPVYTMEQIAQMFKEDKVRICSPAALRRIDDKHFGRCRSKNLRITEIPPDGVNEILKCPFCNRSLPVGLVENGKSDGVTTVCKKCKRTLSISTEGIVTEKQAI